MVHIEDLGSEFDAPIETVWKFLNSPADHGSSHRDQRNPGGAPDKDGWMRVWWEQKVGEHWVKVVNRTTTFPPLMMIVESVEGPLAGSKFVFYYTPHGAKTGVTAIGDFHSATIPPAHLEKTVLASFEEAFNDDNVAIQRMAGRK